MSCSAIARQLRCHHDVITRLIQKHVLTNGAKGVQGPEDREQHLVMKVDEAEVRDVVFVDLSTVLT